MQATDKLSIDYNQFDLYKVVHTNLRNTLAWKYVARDFDVLST